MCYRSSRQHFVLSKNEVEVEVFADIYFQNSNAISDYELRSALFDSDINVDVSLPSIIALF